jgi:uncharacterized OB-fold protein
VGQLITYTTVHVPRPGLTVPYTLGQVSIPNGPLVFGQIRGMDGHPALPLPVHLALANEDSVPGPWYWFEPAE